MARPNPYQVAIGETLTLYVEALTGDPATATSLVAKLKSIDNPQANIPAESVLAVATLTVTLQTTSPGLNTDGTAIKPGWYVTLAAATTATLAAGYYITDLAFAVAGAEIVTDPVVVQISPAVSLP